MGDLIHLKDRRPDQLTNRNRTPDDGSAAFDVKVLSFKGKNGGSVPEQERTDQGSETHRFTSDCFWPICGATGAHLVYALIMARWSSAMSASLNPLVGAVVLGTAVSLLAVAVTCFWRTWYGVAVTLSASAASLATAAVATSPQLQVWPWLLWSAFGVMLVGSTFMRLSRNKRLRSLSPLPIATALGAFLPTYLDNLVVITYVFVVSVPVLFLLKLSNDGRRRRRT